MPKTHNVKTDITLPQNQQPNTPLNFAVLTPPSALPNTANTLVNTKIWGLTNTQRLARMLQRSGICIISAEEAQTHPPETPVLIINTEYVYDMPILKGVIQTPNAVFYHNNTPLIAHTQISALESTMAFLKNAAPNTPPTKKETQKSLTELTIATIVKTFNDALRKKEAPYCLCLQTEDIRHIHHKVFMGTYKGVTDVITKYVWPKPAMVVTKWCAALGISPNMVTIIGVVLMFCALFLFAQGHYGLGLLLGWIFTFLDTVDGKLARVQFTSSKFGHVLDHGTDLLHPPFWYAAWVYGLHHTNMALAPLWESILLTLIIGGYIFQRIQEGYFIVRFGMHMHIWRKFDSFFRLITARRNPNMVFMTLFVVIGRPDLSIWALAIWTALCLLVHMEQIISAEFTRLQKKQVTSWLSQK